MSELDHSGYEVVQMWECTYKQRVAENEALKEALLDCYRQE